MTTPSASAREPSPREHARNLASRGCIALGRLLFAVAFVEIAAAIVRAVAEPDSTPAILVHFAAVGRALYAVLGAVAAARFVPLARALGVRGFALGACVAFAVSAVAALVPFFAVVPTSLSDDAWDALMQLVRAAAFVSGACLSLLVARTFAEREAQPFVARHLAWTVMPLCMCLAVALQAIDPTLVPSPLTAPIIALLLPWAMVAVGLMRWDVGLWATLALLALTGTVMFGRTIGALTLPAVGLAEVLALAAIASGGALHELAPSLAEASSDTISRTLIRHLFGGTLGGGGGVRPSGASSRLGDLDPDSSKPPTDEKAEDAEHLARAYRELGIEAPRRASDPAAPLAPADATDPLTPAEPEPLAPLHIAPLVPISQLTAIAELSAAAPAAPTAPTPPAAPPDPDEPVARLAPVVVLPTAWGEVDRGLKGCSSAFVARVLIVVFGFLWSAGPIGSFLPAEVAFDLALTASSVVFAIALGRLRTSPAESLRRPALVAHGLAVALVCADAVLAIVRLTAVDRHALIAVDAAIGVAATAAFLVVVSRLAADRRQPKLRGRARGAQALLATWAALGAGTLAVRALPASDLQWLAWPLGFATAAVGMGLWILLLWLTRDARDALEA